MFCEVAVVHFLESRRGVVADGVARPIVIVVLDVSFDNVCDVISAPAFCNVEIGIQFPLSTR